MAGHPDGRRHADVLDDCQKAVTSGEAAFPLSMFSLMEIANIRQHRQRRHLRDIIEYLSGYRVVMSRLLIIEREIEAVLDTRFGPTDNPLIAIPYLDQGVLRALGIDGRFRIVDEVGDEVHDGVVDAHLLGLGEIEYSDLPALAEVMLNRGIIEGPRPDDESELRKLGWIPRPTGPATTDLADRENDIAERLRKEQNWYRQRLRDVVAAREVALNYNEELFRQLTERGKTLNETVPTVPAAREFFDAMPSFDVVATLKAAYHRNLNYNWSRNDIYDIEALASTVPYCDIIVTDKSAKFHVNNSGLAERLGSVVVSDLRLLSEFL